MAGDADGRNKRRAARPSVSEQSPSLPRVLKTSERVALDIVRDIVDQGLKSGDRLPPEAEMLGQYRVSRSSLREALRLLETQGLIAIRPGAGAGTVVCEAAPNNLGRTMTLYFHFADVTYQELLDTWMLIEPMLAELAARNPDAEARRAIMGPFLADSQTATGVFRSVPAGSSFHGAVARLARNRSLEMTARAIGAIVSDHILQLKTRTELESFIIDEHATLARSIMDGRPGLSRELMAEHVAHLIADFRHFWPSKVGERVRWG